MYILWHLVAYRVSAAAETLLLSIVNDWDPVIFFILMGKNMDTEGLTHPT
jgi:hypothetical protein